MRGTWICGESGEEAVGEEEEEEWGRQEKEEQGWEMMFFCWVF